MGRWVYLAGRQRAFGPYPPTPSRGCLGVLMGCVPLLGGGSAKKPTAVGVKEVEYTGRPVWSLQVEIASSWGSGMWEGVGGHD